MDLTLATAHSSMPPPDFGNRLLASLPEDDLLHLESLCEQVHSEVGDVLYAVSYTHLTLPTKA